MSSDQRVERILAVKLADLGDLMLCEPAFRSLRSAYPDARIDVLVPPSSRQLVPLLDLGLNATTFPKHVFDDPRGFLNPFNSARAARFALTLRRTRYDRVVLFHHLTTPGGALKFRALVAATRAPSIVGLDNGRGTFLTQRVDDLGYGARHESSYMLSVALAAGGGPVAPEPRFPVSAIIHSHDVKRPYAVLYPATGPYSSAREWPVERYAELARMLVARGLTVVVVGAADAAPAARMIQAACPEAIDLTRQTTIPELAGVVHSAEVVIGGDSFVGHLAAALGRPLVAIFGPTNVDAWRPVGAEITDGGVVASRLVVVHEMPCQPCLYTGFSLGRRLGCPSRTCIDRVAVENVLRAARRATGAP